MSLQTRIEALATAIGTDVKTILANQGSLAALSTTAKSSLVAAINEVKASIGSGGGVSINDSSTTSTTETWSASKSTAAIAAAVSGLLGGASSAFDTLKELQDAIASDETSISGLLTAVGNRIRFDASQTLTSGQITTACTNLGVGEPETNFVATYTTAKS